MMFILEKRVIFRFCNKKFAFGQYTGRLFSSAIFLDSVFYYTQDCGRVSANIVLCLSVQPRAEDEQCADSKKS